jgi:1-acyl-sn-glycerol-3-phosphate acyltransferase
MREQGGHGREMLAVGRLRRWSAAALATVTGNLYLLLGSLLFGLLTVATGWLSPRGNQMFRFGRLWGRGLLAASGARLAVEFEAPLDRRGRYVFMPNHQSMYDIPAMFAALPVQTRFMAKRSLFRIPVFGWAMKVGGFIPIDRADRSRAREAFGAAVDRLREGASILIFPEETRSWDGRLLPFQRGGFLLALKSGLQIVPVGIRGTGQVQRRRSLVIHPGPVKVVFGKPVPVAEFGLRGKRELVAAVRGRVAELAGVRLAEEEAAADC